MRKWADMTWEEVDRLDRAKTVLVLPLGSTEQHGQRLPVKTDSLLAQHLAEQVVEQVVSAVLLPTLNYGMSQHHTAFAGTMSIRGPNYAFLVRDLLISLAESGFKRILIVNGHGGNHQWIEQAIPAVCKHNPGLVVSNPLMKLVHELEAGLAGDFGESMVHAGAAEVSMIAAIDPKEIRPTEVVTVSPTAAKWGEGTASAEEWKQKFPMGQKGDQRNLRLDKGEYVNTFILAKLIEEAKRMAE